MNRTTATQVNRRPRNQAPLQPAHLLHRLRQIARTVDGFFQASPANQLHRSSHEQLRHDANLIRLSTIQF